MPHSGSHVTKTWTILPIAFRLGQDSSTTDSSLTECKMISKFNEKALQSLERGIHFFQGSEHDIYGNSCVLGGHLITCDGKDT